MKQILFLLIVSLSLVAGSFTKNTTVSNPVLVQDGKKKLWCSVCGMNLKKFYKTSHIASLEDKTKHQYCSIRCLAVDMQSHKIDKDTIYVIDAKTQKAIKAQEAYYVVKSKVKGTMSKVSKIAFKNLADAKAFKKKYRGKIVDFTTALQMAQNSLSSDIAMVMKKKKKLLYPMGEKIYNHLCKKDINFTTYNDIASFKAALPKLCKPLKGKKLQALTLYLWDIKRKDIKKESNQIIEVTNKEKCPVCGMFVYKYPKWAAQIFYKHNGHIHHFSFDGVKDLMKFYFKPKKWGDYKVTNKNIAKILVTDYYSELSMDGTKAYYVIGSDIYGPMGNELIPFKTKEDAKTFMSDHFGTQILEFKAITEDLLYQLD